MKFHDFFIEHFIVVLINLFEVQKDLGLAVL